MTSIVSLDQFTKSLATEFLLGKETISYCYDVFRLTFAENSGAFLSVGSNLSQELRQLIFIGLVAILLISLFVYLIINFSTHPNKFVGLILILSGGISNLYDRIQYHGVVVDFMNVGIGTYRTGIFNIADVSIVIGAFLIMLTFYKKFNRGNLS